MTSANNNAEIQALKTAHAEEINQLKDQITVLMSGMTSMNTRLALYESREEDREEHFQEEPPKTEKQPETPDLAAILAKFNTLEQSVQDKEKTTAIGVDMKKLNLFPEVKLPENFKYPDITKFDGTQDPRTHLMSYINAMSMKAVTEAGMAKLFPQSLIGQPLMWFLNLGDHDKASWDAIAKAFVNQYSHNFELEVTTQELESTRMSATESFADFVKRWRAKAAMVTPKLSDKEQIRVMSKCLPLHLTKHMLYASSHTEFSVYYQHGLMIETAIRDGILEKPIPPNRRNYSNNSYSNPGTNSYSNSNHNPNTNFSPNSTYNRPSSSNTSNSTNNQSRNAKQPESVNQIFSYNYQNDTQRKKREFTPLNFPRDQIFRKLVRDNVLKPLQPPPKQTDLPANHRTDLYCEYHQTTGHTTLNCQRLAHKIQNLIETGVIPAPPPSKPNTVTNPLPQHQGPQINHLSLSSTENLNSTKDLNSTENPNSTKDHPTITNPNSSEAPSSTTFDPSRYIIPASEPKPTVSIPQETTVLALEPVVESQDQTLTKEITRAENSEWDPTPDFYQCIPFNDPLDTWTLPYLFREDEPQAEPLRAEDSEWDPTPDFYQLIPSNDPLDTWTLPYLFREDEPRTISKPHLCSWGNRKKRNSSLCRSACKNTQGEQLDEEERLSKREKKISAYLDLCMVNIWEELTTPTANLWEDLALEQITQGPSFIASANIMQPVSTTSPSSTEDLSSTKEPNSTIQPDQIQTDAWEELFEDVDHVTRTGRVYKPPNLQADRPYQIPIHPNPVNPDDPAVPLVPDKLRQPQYPYDASPSLRNHRS